MAAQDSEDLKAQITSESLFGHIDQHLLEEGLSRSSTTVNSADSHYIVARLCQFHNETPDSLYYLWESTKHFGSRSASYVTSFDATGLEALKGVLQKKSKTRQVPMKRLGRLAKVKTEPKEAPPPVYHAPPVYPRVIKHASKVVFKGPDVDEATRRARKCKPCATGSRAPTEISVTSPVYVREDERAQRR